MLSIWIGTLLLLSKRKCWMRTSDFNFRYCSNYYCSSVFAFEKCANFENDLNLNQICNYSGQIFAKYLLTLVGEIVQYFVIVCLFVNYTYLLLICVTIFIQLSCFLFYLNAILNHKHNVILRCNNVNWYHFAIYFAIVFRCYQLLCLQDYW